MVKLGSLGSEFLIGLYPRYQGMLQSFEGLAGVGESASRKALSHNYQLDAPVFHYMELSIKLPECPYDMALLPP